MTNTLYYGDNLDILRQHVPDESVDLIYLDPPFNSNASYNVLFKEQTGEESPAQIKAFTDTWEWTQESERVFEQEIIMHPATPPNVKDMITAFREFIGRNAMMAYLVMMTPRLVELRRVLKPTGSIYLHCDPTASHYLKLLMDAVFDSMNFRSEIVWRRSNAHNKLSKQYGPIHDTLLFYTKSPKFTFHPGRRPYTKSYVKNSFPSSDERGRYQSNVLTGMGIRTGESGRPWKGYDPTPRGRHWAIPSKIRREVDPSDKAGSPQDILDAMDNYGLILHPRAPDGLPRYKQYLDSSEGLLHQDIWAFQPGSRGLLWNSDEAVDEDVKWLDSESERLGYPTQKPLGLLERIIESSSNEGDVVLDPFCGCGTAVAAAEKLKRKWIGVDVTHLAVALMKNRLKTAFNIVPGADYDVVGEPADVGSAHALAEQDRYQFQFWAMSLLEAFPREQNKRGADRGIDGVLHFIDGPRRATHKAVVQVKSGKVSSPLIRDLKGTVDRENAALGLFITLEDPTRDMRTEAVSAGFYHSEVWQRDYPKIQIRTVEDLLTGNTFDLPPHPSMYQPAQRVRRPEGKQSTLEEAG
ncbi:MAG: site-specific DNA-methyltransferase [Dehalococcoidia bacterium]|nr:site-specific DNA-methyltransferase [Dehalococcoidia bacterium]